MPEFWGTLKLSAMAKPGQLDSLRDLGRDRSSGWWPAFWACSDAGNQLEPGNCPTDQLSSL